MEEFLSHIKGFTPEIIALVLPKLIEDDITVELFPVMTETELQTYGFRYADILKLRLHNNLSTSQVRVKLFFI